MGYILEPTVLVEETAPEVAKRMRRSNPAPRAGCVTRRRAALAARLLKRPA